MQQLEKEVKLEVRRGWSLPDLAGVLPGVTVAPLPTLAMRTTYYDTADQRLARHGLSLRWRVEALAQIDVGTAGAADSDGKHLVGAPASPVWTIKFPSSTGDDTVLVRTELTWPAEAPGVPPRSRDRRRRVSGSHGGPVSGGDGGPVSGGDGDGAGAHVGAVHPEAVQFLAAVSLGHPLEPVAHLSTTRQRTALRTSDGRLLVEIDHDTVTGTRLARWSTGHPGGREVVFTEVEVELAEGSALEVLEAVVDKLVATGARRSSRKSKLATVLQSSPPPGSETGNVAPSGSTRPKAKRANATKAKPTVADLLSDQARDCLEVLLEHDPPIRLGDPETEHVHRSRVATRRFRSVIKAFAPLVTSDQTGAGDETERWFAALSGELRWLGHALGSARDGDVRLQTLERDAGQLADGDASGAARVLDVARADEQRSHEMLLSVMGTDRYIQLLRVLEAIGQKSSEPRASGASGTARAAPAPGEATGTARAAPASGETTGPARAAPASGETTGPAADLGPPTELWVRLAQPAAAAMVVLAGKQWRSVARSVGRLGDEPTDEALHRVRIHVKRLRYLAEVAAPVLPSAADRDGANRTVKAATALQDVLGAVHDSAVNEQWLRDIVSREPGGASVKADPGPRRRRPTATESGAALSTALAAGLLIARARQAQVANREAWPAAWARLDRRRQLRWTTGH